MTLLAAVIVTALVTIPLTLGGLYVLLFRLPLDPDEPHPSDPE